MKRKIIRLTESDLHRIIKESVRKLIREHDPDDPDYGQYGDTYDGIIRECEKESSIETFFIPTKKQLVFDEPDEEGEWNDYYFSVIIEPKFTKADEYGFDLEDVDFRFDVGNDEIMKEELMQQYGDIVDELIDDNFDAIYNAIKRHSDYTIY